MTIAAQPLVHRREWVGVMLGLAAILAWATSAASVLWIGRQVGVWQYLVINSLIACGGHHTSVGLGPKPRLVEPRRNSGTDNLDRGCGGQAES